LTGLKDRPSPPSLHTDGRQNSEEEGKDGPQASTVRAYGVGAAGLIRLQALN
jgi:hypothetical protein